MRALGRWWDGVTIHPYVFDGAVAALLYVGLLIGSGRDHPSGPTPLTPLGVVLTGVVFGALVLRRRWPLAVLAFTTVGVPVLIGVNGPKHPFAFAVGVAAYTVGARLDRTTAVWAGATSAAILGAGAVLFSANSWTEPATLLVMVFTAMTTAAGIAVGNHRAYVAAVEERARRAEHSREEEAHRRVIEERMRIARELHDVVAHHIALINVQAGVAAHLIRSDGEAATTALRHVRSASRAVLSELSTLLGVLRSADDADAPVEPAPGLGRLDVLLESFARTGLTFSATSHGAPRPLPPGIDLAAYRIVQEALTNVHKHASGAPASVDLTYGRDSLAILVRNPAGAANGCAPSTGTGHGILGMRERVAAFGGTFEAGAQPDGGYVVQALLPLPDGANGDDPGPARR